MAVDPVFVGKNRYRNYPPLPPPRCRSAPSVSKVTPPTPQLIFYTAELLFLRVRGDPHGPADKAGAEGVTLETRKWNGT